MSVYVHLSICLCLYATVHVRRLEDNFWTSGLLLLWVSGIELGPSGLQSRYFHPHSHLTSLEIDSLCYHVSTAGIPLQFFFYYVFILRLCLTQAAVKLVMILLPQCPKSWDSQTGIHL